MKISALILPLLGAALLVPTTMKAAPIFHWKATALFPVQTEEPDPNPHAPLGATIIKKVSLGTNELINLALGQDLKTKNPDKVLAVRANHDDPDHATLVVGQVITHSDHTKSVTVLATLFTLLDPVNGNTASKDGDKGTANGLSRGRISTVGNATNGLTQTDVCCSATAGITPGPTGPAFKLSVTGIIGPIQGKIAGVTLDGLIIKGMFTSSGKPIDHF